MLGLENVGSYMQAKQAYKFADWSEVILDEEGKVVQEEMTRKFQVGDTISMDLPPHL
jgi:exportin-5